MVKMRKKMRIGNKEADMKNKILSVIAVLVIAFSTCMAAVAAENPADTKAKLRSKGAIHYADKEGDVIIDSADFYKLADQLDLFKVRAVKQLGVMRTYLTRSGGDVAMTSADGVYAVHNKPQDGEEADPLSLDFATILEGIAVSQSIPTDPAAYGMPAGTKLYKKADGTLGTDDSNGAEPIDIQAATAGNLSAGTAAWVNGELMLGTGEDTAKMIEEAVKAMGGDGGVKKHSISSTHTLSKDVTAAFAYVVTMAHASDGIDGNEAGVDPVLTVSSYKSLKKLFGERYARNGFNVRVGLYYMTGLPAGTKIKGSSGLLFY